MPATRRGRRAAELPERIRAPPVNKLVLAEDTEATCRACGACCAFSAEWPRFALENDAVLDRIPREFVDDERGRMRCEGDRCSALVGEVGRSTSCSVYAVRPDVCRECLPGDPECLTARRRFGV